MKKIILVLVASTLSACSAQLLSRDQVNTVNLIKVKGRVVRYDCAGRVTSDKIETTQYPTKWLEWRPEHETDLYSSSIRNRSTGDSPGIMGFTQFQVTMDKFDLIAVRVKAGINDFDYTFRICDEWSAVDPATEEKTCLSSSIWEEGSFQIDVHYEQKTTDAVEEYHPSAEECAPPAP